MPKQISIPAPTYGSPEWKAERARMVGTPEWKAANNYNAPTGDPMSQGVFFSSPLIFTPAGKTLTTAEKQAQTPLYNPLYDPSTPEYQANLIRISNPNQQKTATPQVQIPPVIASSNYPPLVKPPTHMQQGNNFMPSVFAPNATRVEMPDAVKRTRSEFGKNWGDLFSAVQNRYNS